jgi:squalene-hopene/tetraprenyl-beta-curcumene cyclase
VLGLVSVDVMSVTVEGLENGQHVAGKHSLAASARDNKGVGVSSVEVFVDDIRAYGVCAAALDHELDTTGWQPGKHVVEVRAHNARGQVSRRFLDVYAGDVYLTQIGTRFTGEGTEISLRNILEADRSSRVEVEIFAAVDKDGDVSAGEKVHSMSRAGRQGSMSFQWDGEGAEGAGSGDKYVARLTMFDERGERVQSEDVVFVHDTLQAQRASWAQLEGQLALPGGDVAQNAEVELVDDAGRVVGRTVSTKQGKFRFRNVKSKKGYKVRVNKQGFAAEAPAAAELGEDNKVDLQLQMD